MEHSSTLFLHRRAGGLPSARTSPSSLTCGSRTWNFRTLAALALSEELFPRSRWVQDAHVRGERPRFKHSNRLSIPFMRVLLSSACSPAGRLWPPTTTSPRPCPRGSYVCWPDLHHKTSTSSSHTPASFSRALVLASHSVREALLSLSAVSPGHFPMPWT